MIVEISNKNSNSNSNENLNSDLDSDSDSDLDEKYIDLSDKIDSSTCSNIYQFQINLDRLELKLIGIGSDVPDIIIKEKFGPDLNLYLYSCIFSLDEISKGFANKYFFPLIRLVQIFSNYTKINSFSIQLNQPVQLDSFDPDNNWELFWTEELTNDSIIKTIQIEKTIDVSNIVEKLIEHSFNKTIK